MYLRLHRVVYHLCDKRQQQQHAYSHIISQGAEKSYLIAFSGKFTVQLQRESILLIWMTVCNQTTHKRVTVEILSPSIFVDLRATNSWKRSFPYEARSACGDSIRAAIVRWIYLEKRSNRTPLLPVNILPVINEGFVVGMIPMPLGWPMLLQCCSC